MSDALHKVLGIKTLPIFPLPLVMLPGELLPLHIFEDRYRQMLKDVASTGNLFGIVFFDGQQSFESRPVLGAIGCVAEVRESESLEDGRSNILTLGIVRFRLIDYVDVPEPYLVGEIQFIEDESEEDPRLDTLTDEVFGLFERMAKAAFKMSGSRSQLPEIQRAEPEALSFLIAAAFNFENEKKYSLLETTSTVDRLDQLRRTLVRAVAQLADSANIQTALHTNGHSKKKLEL